MDWLGRFVSRPQIEELALESSRQPTTIVKEVNQIWETKFWRDLRGPDGLPLFPSPPDDLRLVFALNVDGFNPFGNKAAGSVYSTTAIYMSCLNLPPHVRFLPQNMYIATFVPGPSAPHGASINAVFKPVIDQMIHSTKGVYIEPTALSSSGRLVQASLGIVVADMPASSQATGRAGHSSGLNPCGDCDIDSNMLKYEVVVGKPRSPQRRPRVHPGVQ